MAMNKKLLTIRKYALENQNNNNSSRREVHLTKNKHLDVFIFLFFGAVLVASIFIILNIFGVFTKVDSYYALKATVEDGISYDNELTCVLHFKGNASSVNSEKNEITKKYTAALKGIHLRADAVNAHKQSASIALINQNIGKATYVDQEVYAMLQEAYAISNIDDNNYSIFASPLYEHWLNLCSFAKLGNLDSDPLINEDERNYLNELTSIINDANNYSIEFLEDNRIKVDISETYQAFIDKYELDTPIISLNVLENVFKIEAAKKVLVENGYTDGYITTRNGLGLTLEGLESLAHSIFNVSKPEGEIGYINYSKPHVFKKTMMYEYLNANEYQYYQITGSDSVTHYRNINLNLKTGYPNEQYLATYMISEELTLKEMCLANQRLMLVDSLEKETDFINNNKNIEVCLNRLETPNSYFLTKNVKELIYLFNSEVYYIDNINREEN